MDRELKRKIKELEPYLRTGRMMNGNIIIDLYNEFYIMSLRKQTREREERSDILPVVPVLEDTSQK